METFNLKEADKTTECKGLFWRGSVSTYLSSHKSIEERKSLRLLKSKSCSGCPQCDWLWEFLSEDLMEGIKYTDNIENGKLYTHKIHTSKDYYELHSEVDSIEFKEVKE